MSLLPIILNPPENKQVHVSPPNYPESPQKINKYMSLLPIILNPPRNKQFGLLIPVTTICALPRAARDVQNLSGDRKELWIIFTNLASV